MWTSNLSFHTLEYLWKFGYIWDFSAEQIVFQRRHVENAVVKCMEPKLLNAWSQSSCILLVNSILLILQALAESFL